MVHVRLGSAVVPGVVPYDVQELAAKYPKTGSNGWSGRIEQTMN
jgi:hypothetical protein